MYKRQGDFSKPEQTKIIWRKLSPEEILQVAARKITTNEIETAHPGGRGEVASGGEKVNGDQRKDGAKDAITGASEGKHNETVRTPQGTTRVVTLKSGTPCPQDAIHREECYGNQSAQSRQVIPSLDRKETRQFSGWESIDIKAITAGAGEVNGMKVCQFEDCSKRARFGINGIVRYW